VDLLVRMGSNPIPGALILVLNARANCLISSVVVAVAISKSSPLNCTAYMFHSVLDFRKLIEAFFPKFF
jgi:hypothetical protein